MTAHRTILRSSASSLGGRGGPLTMANKRFPKKRRPAPKTEVVTRGCTAQTVQVPDFVKIQASDNDD